MEPLAALRAFLLAPPVCTVSPGIIVGTDTATTRKAALAWAAAHRVVVQRSDVGDIEFSKTGVKNSLAHSFYPQKIEAIPAIPRVLELGKVIDISPDFDGKPLTNIFIAAPIQIGTVSKLLVVRVRKHDGGSNKFYVHDLYDVTGAKNMSDTFKPGGSVQTVGLSRSVAHVESILQTIFSVKG
jgi:hypothetical protein